MSSQSTTEQQARREAPAARQYQETGKTTLSPAVMVADFDPNIHVDNTKEGYASNNTSPQKTAQTNGGNNHVNLTVSSHNDSSCPVRLAARTILSHLVNHLFHFPMGGGAASLSSMVCEHDDLPALAAGVDELSMDVFAQPNVQLFIVNDTTLLSFIELPTMDAGIGSLAGIKTAESQVRVIL
jgi:hypothetical protein